MAMPTYRAADELGHLPISMPSASLGAQTLPTISTVVHSGVNQRLATTPIHRAGGDPGLSATALIPKSA